MCVDVNPRAESPGSAGGASCKDAMAPSAPSQGATKRGFTLIELLLSLTLGSLVVLLAHRVFAGVVDGAARVEAARAALDREANARRFLHEAFGSLDVGTERAGGFTGRPERVEFATWRRTAEGWLSRERMTLAARDGRLVASGRYGEIVFGDSVVRVAFDYLLEAGATEAWVREWVSPVSAPVAVRMRITRDGKRDTGNVDTLLFIVGPRG